jgi:hypothetical protein
MADAASHIFKQQLTRTVSKNALFNIGFASFIKIISKDSK